MCMEPKKELGHICNCFPIGAKSFPNIRNNICTKFPFYFPNYITSFWDLVFGKFSSMFWYLPWVGSMHKSIMVRRPSTPFENIQPISKTFAPHGRDWRKSYRKRPSNIVLRRSLRRYCWNFC